MKFKKTITEKDLDGMYDILIASTFIVLAMVTIAKVVGIV